MSAAVEDPVTSKPSAPEREETMETAEVESLVSNNGDNNNTTTTAAMPQLSDGEALRRAKEHMRNDQVLVASRLLQQMTKIPEEDEVFQKEVERKTALIESVIADLLADPRAAAAAAAAAAENGGENNTTNTEEEAAATSADQWLPMGESHNEHRDTVSYYQLSEDLQLKCRFETPVESSLLVPLLSVLIETDLFTTFLPRWNVPKVGLGTVNKLADMGRTEQIVHFISDVPWPFTRRDCMIQTVACDDIDDLEGPTTGTIVIGLHSLEAGDTVKRSVVCNEHYAKIAPEVLDIPPPLEDEGMKRALVEGGLLIRKCPEDHISLQGSTVQYPPGEHLILVGFSISMDAKISPMFPKYIINFVIQTAIVQMWAKFLKTAEEIRDGSRPQHAEHIAAKREEIYDWVDQRIEAMFANLQQKNDDTNNNTTTTDATAAPTPPSSSEKGKEKEEEQEGEEKTTKPEEKKEESDDEFFDATDN